MKLHEELANELDVLKEKYNLQGYIFICVRKDEASYVKQTNDVFHALLGAMRQMEFEAMIEQHDKFLITGTIDV